MALFSQSDLVASIPEATQLLALDDNSDGAADTGAFAAVLADAEVWIAGYLEQAGLTLPSPAPSRLKHLGMRYAEYTLWRRRGAAEKAKQVYEEWLARGIKWLERIASGEESLLPLPLGDPAAEPGAITAPAKSHASDGRLMV